MIGAIIQARLDSKRFPMKVLKSIDGKILLEVMINRVKKSKKINKIIVSTTENSLDKELVLFCKQKNIYYYIGSEFNVMDRFVQTAINFNINTIVRLTADCPLVDPNDIDNLISFFDKNYDYCANTCPPNKSSYPDGSDIEIFLLESLKKINQIEKRNSYREHVTYNYWKDSNYKSFILKNDIDLSNYRYTLDYKEDFKVLKIIFKHFGKNIESVSTNEIVNFLKSNPEVYSINSKCKTHSRDWKNK